MLFYEPLFLFLFFPMAFGLYLITPARARIFLLLATSLCFYLWSEPLFVPVVLASAAIDHWLARRIAAAKGNAAYAVAAGVVMNIGILVYFKYTMFFLHSLNDVLALLQRPGFAIPAIALPIGVSFIVFEKITYLVDVKRGISRPAPTLSTYLTYVFFFPKLLAGPIIKYHEMADQLVARPAPRADDILTGFSRFMLGVVKKTLLADTLATGADLVFAADPSRVGFHAAWFGVLCFTFQIYFDFSAYSDMAIGIARMFGFRLRENFNFPYLSRSISEFWRRWHISLSTWIREYLYYPLGGNRAGKARALLNLWICFLASGLWHGAAWTYVVWGAYNGVFLVLDKLFLQRVLDRMPPRLANGLTFLIVILGWVIFRATSLPQAWSLTKAMFDPLLPDRVNNLYFTNDVIVALLAGLVICVLPRLPGYTALTGAFSRNPSRRAAVESVMALLFLVSLSFSLAAPFKPFLYFRF